MTIKSKPILFNGEMVRAILDGCKTQTRRVVKPIYKRFPIVNLKDHGANNSEAYYSGRFNDPESWGFAGIEEGPTDWTLEDYLCFPSPYKKGDLLWVRESWSTTFEGAIFYRATPSPRDEGKAHFSWESPIYMPKELSRLTLEITDVRVERLQDISEEDAIAEGIQLLSGYDKPAYQDYTGADYMTYNARKSFNTLWDSINGKDEAKNWQANPWVWVIEFKAHNKNVMEMLNDD